MKDRIQVDGVWYVREDKKQIEIDLIEFKGCLYETDEFCFEATLTYDDDGELYPDVSIKFTDKRVKPWKEDHWDNNNWFRGVYEDKPESYESAVEELGVDGAKQFQAFINKLVEKEWLELK